MSISQVAGGGRWSRRGSVTQLGRSGKRAKGKLGKRQSQARWSPVEGFLLIVLEIEPRASYAHTHRPPHPLLLSQGLVVS